MLSRFLYSKKGFCSVSLIYIFLHRANINVMKGSVFASKFGSVYTMAFWLNCEKEESIMKSEVVSYRIPGKDKEYFYDKAKRKGLTLNEYCKKALYMSEEKSIINSKAFTSKYVAFKNEINQIDDLDVRKNINNYLEELICLL